jgi:hypothetical protein
MRKLLYTAMGAAVLATASIANAAVTVTSSTNLSSPNPTSSIVTNDGITTINFGQNPVTSPTFDGSFTFTNDVAGMYSFVIGSSTTGLAFDLANTMVSGGGQTWDFTALSPRQLSLDPIELMADTAYTVSFAGTSPVGGAVTGNVTISAAAVPEAATWAMMLLGFGAMGLAIRRRRQPVLAQLA